MTNGKIVVLVVKGEVHEAEHAAHMHGFCHAQVATERVGGRHEVVLTVPATRGAACLAADWYGEAGSAPFGPGTLLFYQA